MSAAAVRFESVTARDVALVVLEELSLSDAFRSWLCEASGLDCEGESATVLGARDSFGGAEGTAVEPARGRSTVEVDLEYPDERVGLLLTITTDTDAPDIAPDALERIRTRRDRALEERWEDCRIVLFARAADLERATDIDSPFDATVPLESLRDRFAARDTERGAYRARLLSAAIDGGRGRESATGSPAVVDAYRSLAAEREPDFEFRAVADLDRDLETESNSDGAEENPDAPVVAIDAPSLAEDHTLVHALADGTVDLRIPGAGAHLQTFAARYASAIPTATDLLTDGDALVLRLSVPAIDFDSSGDASSGDDAVGSDAAAVDGDAPAIDEVDEAAIDEALTAARDLLTVSEHVNDRSS